MALVRAGIVILGVVAACGSTAPTAATDAGGPKAPVLPVDRDAGGDSVPVEPPGGCPSAGRRCTPAAPAGWAGPMLVYRGQAASAPSCPTSMALRLLDAHGGTPTGAHSCAACTCGGPTGIACTAYMEEYSDDNCASLV